MKNLRNTGATAEANDIQQALCRYYYDHKYAMFNTYIFEWESDYLSINESGYIYECEIKVSKADFKKDFIKKDKHVLLESKEDPVKKPNKFYYVCPRGILPSYQIPEYAGLIEISDSETGYELEKIKNAPFLHREKMLEVIQPQLLDKFYHKYKRTELDNYELQHKIKELEEKLKMFENGIKKI